MRLKESMTTDNRKTDKIFFISRAVGRYFAIKRYAVCKECALPLETVLPDAGTQRADMLCVDKSLDVVIVETKSSWEDFHSDHKWQAYLEWCNRFYFAADEAVAVRIAQDRTIKASRVGVLSINEQGKVTALRACVKRNPPTLMNNQRALLLSMIFRLSPFELGGKLRENTCFFPNVYFEEFN